MLSTLGLRIRTGLTRLVVKTKRLLHESIRPLPAVVGLLRDLTRSRGQLIAENTLLRQQLIVASRKVKRPVFKPHERGLMVLLSRIVRGWRDAVLLVKPETILRWSTSPSCRGDREVHCRCDNQVSSSPRRASL